MKIQLRHLFKTHKGKIILAGVALAALIVLALATLNRYPVAMVNGSPISANRFWKNYDGALRYADFIEKNSTSSVAKPVIPSNTEIQAQVLSQMVEAELIHQAAGKEVGSDLDYLVDNKLDRHKSNQSLAQAARALYGMDLNDFRDEVMIPEAKKEILLGRLYLRGENFEEWFAEIKKSANVSIFSGKFSWDGERVVSVTSN